MSLSGLCVVEKSIATGTNQSDTLLGNESTGDELELNPARPYSCVCITLYCLQLPCTSPCTAY